MFAVILTLVACKSVEDMTPAKSSEKSMSSFSFSSLSPAVSATITGTTVSAVVPFNVDVTSLAPTITVAAKATVSPASGSTQNFTNAVTYTVKAEDGTTAAYSVTVTKGIVPKSTAKDITKFSFAALSPVVEATIDATTKAITATVPATTDITKLVPTITISDKATVSPASGVATDFSKEVSYTVTAEDASTVVWKVNVKKEVVSTLSKGTTVFVVSGKYMLSLNGLTGTINWKFDTGEDYNFDTPIYENGVLYFSDSHYKFYAIDANTGVKKWDYKTVGPSNISSSSTIEKGVVYFSTIGGTVYALDANTGNTKWTFKDVNYIFDKSSPTVADGILYIGNSNFRTLLALDATTGIKKWDFKTQGAVNSNPVVLNGFVYFGSADRNFYALDAKTGAKAWESSLTGGFEYNDATILNDILYVGSNGKELLALDIKNGTKKWSYSLFFTGAPYVSNATVYANDYYSGASLIAIDAKTGVKKWEYGTAKFNNTGPIEANGLVYIGTGLDDKSFDAIDANTGKKVWSIKLDLFLASPCILVDGKIFHSSKSGMQQ